MPLVGLPLTEVCTAKSLDARILIHHFYSLKGLRIAEKRSLPCPNRLQWLAARDKLYEDIMNQAWNAEKKQFGQSFEESDVLDSAVLIMPLVFFMQASDPRFMSTLEMIMKSPERGGLTSNVRPLCAL